MLALDFRVRALTVLALLAALITALVGLMAVPGIADLPALPRSGHAGTAHDGQKWDAASIATTMNNGGCGNVDVYLCSAEDTLVYVCKSPSNPKNLLGLRVGATQHQVITGFSGSIPYWTKKVSGCDYLGPGSLLH